MIDQREAVAREFAARVFLRLFIRPKGRTDEQASEHVGMCFEAVRSMLPKSRSEALPLVARAALRLKAEAKTNAWPTVREVCEAIRAGSDRREGRRRQHRLAAPEQREGDREHGAVDPQIRDVAGLPRAP